MLSKVCRANYVDWGEVWLLLIRSKASWTLFIFGYCCRMHVEWMSTWSRDCCIIFVRNWLQISNRTGRTVSFVLVAHWEKESLYTIDVLLKWRKNCSRMSRTPWILEIRRIFCVKKWSENSRSISRRSCVEHGYSWSMWSRGKFSKKNEVCRVKLSIPSRWAWFERGGVLRLLSWADLPKASYNFFVSVLPSKLFSHEYSHFVCCTAYYFRISFRNSSVNLLDWEMKK